MYYIIYLAGIILFFFRGMGFSNLSNFRDSTTMIFLLIPCLLMLFCTKSLKSFGECFLLPFGKRNYSLLQYKRCLQSLKIVVSTSFISGLICFMISIVNMLKFYGLSDSSEPLLVQVGLDMSVAILPLYYVLVICILLLPLHFMLKQDMMNSQSEGDALIE